MKEILEKLCWDLASDSTGVSRLQKIHPVCLSCWRSTSNQLQNNSEVNLKSAYPGDRLSARNRY